MSSKIKTSFSVREIIVKTREFIFKNILGITLFGSLCVFFEFFLSIINVILLTPLFVGTVTILCGEYLYGRNMSCYQAFKKSIKKLFPLVVLFLYIYVVSILGFLFLIIPGFIVSCATACAVPAMMQEDLGPVQAFNRSWNLTEKNRFRIFGFQCLYLFTIILVFGIFEGITMIIPMDAFYNIGFMLIFAPIVSSLLSTWPVINTLLYFDLRVRKEGMQMPDIIV